MTKIRLGTCSPAAGDTPQGSLAVLERLARRAAAQGVDLLLLPEAFLGSGYPRGEPFGCAVGSRTAAGREAYLQYFRRAVDFGDVVGPAGEGGGAEWVNRSGGRDKGRTDTGAGRETDDGGGGGDRPGDGTRETLERIARETGVFLVTGAIERAGGSLYCAVVYVCPKRGILAKRRKVQPTGSERLIWAAAGPGTLRAVSTEIKGVRINLAAAICWENYMPLVRQSLYAQNVNLYLAPTADGRDTWLSLVRTIGIEGRCFVVSANMCTAKANRASTNDSTAVMTTAHANGTRATTNAALPSATTPVPVPVHAQAQPRAAAPGSSVTTEIIQCKAADGKPRQRKKSFVVDEDGNEIVLSCTAVEDTVQADNTVTDGRRDGQPVVDRNATHSPANDAPEPPLLPPFPRLPVDKAWERHKHERRRSSVFDEDDNEIVLCRPTSGTAIEEETFVDGAGPPTASAPVRTREKETTSEFTTRGGSAIVSPFGDVVAGPQWDDAEGIIFADVDFDDCIRGRLDIDVGGSYSRNDSFKFSVEGLDLSPLPY
ncbi:Nitrilase/cyanide hydratase and apolipoprotein N-acyltransferase [Niveomyces insectorum RCEF 264]|uniref:Nitrilase/cyanide hydratase and apolipoprotein N-acyltransferase n=1 Tax=Niveomyces insectorum RCEF 264 TaxID=1081102 RepID=A0A167NPK6_9HYPO|nr:Nitrilase/cyanide hydratase and apolipoprotein N-acyltransferase [Niveomyces insectorum RCEF 264]